MFYFQDSALMVNILMVPLLVVGHENIFKDSTVIHKFVFLGADPCFIGLILFTVKPPAQRTNRPAKERRRCLETSRVKVLQGSPAH